MVKLINVWTTGPWLFNYGTGKLIGSSYLKLFVVKFIDSTVNSNQRPNDQHMQLFPHILIVNVHQLLNSCVACVCVCVYVYIHMHTQTQTHTPGI